MLRRAGLAMSSLNLEQVFHHIKLRQCKGWAEDGGVRGLAAVAAAAAPPPTAVSSPLLPICVRSRAPTAACAALQRTDRAPRRATGAGRQAVAAAARLMAAGLEKATETPDFR